MLNDDDPKKLFNVELPNHWPFDLMVGRVNCNGTILNINLKRFKSVEFLNEEFVPTEIYDQDGRSVWQFKDEGVKGVGRIFPHEELQEDILVIENWGKIIKVVPINDIPKRKLIMLDGKPTFIGGRSIKDSISIKKFFAKEFKKEAVFSDEEKRFLFAQQEIINKRKAKEREMEEQRKRDELAAKRTERRNKIEAILSRKPIVRYSPDKKKKYTGHPVEDHEWVVLPPDVRVILVKKLYDADANMEALEAFFVGDMLKGKPQKRRSAAVLPYKIEEIRKTVADALGTLFFLEETLYPDKTASTDLVEVSLFSQNGLMQLQAVGLNSGTVIAVGEQDSEKFRVVALHGSECQEIGYFTPEAKAIFAPWGK